MTIKIHQKDNWAFGIKFFIQLAFFEHTGYADWKFRLIPGYYNNRTDGEIHYHVRARRITETYYDNDDTEINTYDEIKFELYGNGYSWKSIYNSTLDGIKEAKIKEVKKQKIS